MMERDKVAIGGILHWGKPWRVKFVPHDAIILATYIATSSRWVYSVQHVASKTCLATFLAMNNSIKYDHISGLLLQQFTATSLNHCKLQSECAPCNMSFNGLLFSALPDNLQGKFHHVK